jgi:DNA-binding protein YbaB
MTKSDNSPGDNVLAGLLREYREHVEQAAQLQEKLAGLTATATAVRQTVKVTVGARGDLTALEFPTGAYRRMPPQELAALIVATAGQAREQVAKEVAELVAPTLPSGMDVGSLIRGQADVRAMFGEQPTMTDDVQEYVNHGRKGTPNT